MRTIVLDTNVLLSDPDALFAYPDAEIILPETVLSELDKLKTARVDPDLRFRGRQVSRVLFELSEQGNLAGGVELPDGGKLRVVPFDHDQAMPEGLVARSADDRILATAYHLCSDGECANVTIVTNDLNMLLKAQTIGLSVERREAGSDASFSKRFIVRPFQRYKIPLGILSMSLAVFAAIVFVVIYSQRPATTAELPTEFRDLLSREQLQVLTYLQDLQSNPNDTETELKLANLYYTVWDSVRANNATSAFTYSELALKHFEKVLAAQPDNLDARTDFASLHFYSGDTDVAIRETQDVLQRNPDHIKANFNLGIILWQGRRDFAAASAQFQKVLDLTENDVNQQSVFVNAQQALAALKADAANAGQPLQQGEGSTQ